MHEVPSRPASRGGSPRIAPFLSILENPTHESRAQEWRAAFARSFAQQKERAREVLDARREKFSALQAELALRMAELADELARQQTESLETGINHDSQRTALEARQAELQKQAEQLAAQQAQWDQAQTQGRASQEQLVAQLQERLAELDFRRGEVEKSERQLQERIAACASREGELEKTQADLAARRASLEQQARDAADLQAELGQSQAEVDRLQQELQDREQASVRQRRSIARQLRARKAELTVELELLRAEAKASPAGQDFDLQMRLSELQGKCERLREEAAQSAQQREDLQERLTAAQLQLAQRQGEWNQAQKQAEQTQARLKQLETLHGEVARERDQIWNEKQRLATDLAKAQADAGAEITAAREAAAAQAQRMQSELSAELQRRAAEMERELAPLKRQLVDQGDAGAALARLRDENKQLEEWLTEAKASAAGGSADVSSQELIDLQRRLEIATSDCRDLKNKNAELQEQLANSKQAGPQGNIPTGGSGGMDWEAQKQRMLAQLESDYDHSDPVQKAERLKIEEALKVTEAVVANKDHELQGIKQELEELRGLLENQSNNIGEFAVGASAFAGMLDKDELVKQERENLQKMQDTMREQLKKAEIDISMERAKIARERAELDGKLHALERERAQITLSDGAAGGDKAKKPGRGRWLSRLGLSDGDSKK